MGAIKGRCQICDGAYILSTRGEKGILAHHGYKRPRHSWQTASCRGARQLPYEVACDLLIEEVDRVKKWLVAEKTWLEKITANPPDTITIEGRGYGGVRDFDKDVEVTRPIDLDKKKPAWQYGNENDRKYMQNYYYMLVDIENRIRSSEHYLVWQEKRLTDWKAPEHG